MGKIRTTALVLAMLGLGINAVGCASGRQDDRKGWVGTELVDVNIKRTKINVGTTSGESIQMVLIEEPGGGKWIENNAGNVVYRWDPASRGWRPTSNPSVAIQLSITLYVEEKPSDDYFSTPTGKQKTTTVKAGSDVYENATVVEASNGAVQIYDKDGNKIFERNSNGQWYRITPYGISAPVNIRVEY
ncbi:MAG: hypothetical protein ACP5JC_02915 [Candidatus Micrarchaeia archaeon]